MVSGAMPSALSSRAGAGRHASSRFREYLMPERPDWNMVGPTIPGWFRDRLPEIDPDLVLQFIPPDTFTKGGCDGSTFPLGVLTVCRRLRQTGWLFKRWVYGMIDKHGLPVPPSWPLLNALRIAHFDHVNYNAGRLEQQLDRHCHQLKMATTDKSKNRLRERIDNQMRALDMQATMTPRIFMPH